MKRFLLPAIFCAALAFEPGALALTAAKAKAAKKAIGSVPFPELPAKAAELVKASAADEREEMATLVVQAAISRSRPSAPLVVAAVSRVAPEVAAVATVAATRIEAAQANAITAAAISAAPSQEKAIISSQKDRGGVPTGGNTGTSGGRGGGNSGGGDDDDDDGDVRTGVSNRGRGSVTPGEDPLPRGPRTDVGAGRQNQGRPPENSNAGGRFPQHPPHGGKPPGHDENHDGRPDWVDYHRPRGL